MDIEEAVNNSKIRIDDSLSEAEIRDAPSRIHFTTIKEAAQILLDKLEITEVITIGNILIRSPFRGRLDCDEYELLRTLAEHILKDRTPWTSQDL